MIFLRIGNLITTEVIGRYGTGNIGEIVFILPTAIAHKTERTCAIVGEKVSYRENVGPLKELGPCQIKIQSLDEKGTYYIGHWSLLITPLSTLWSLTFGGKNLEIRGASITKLPQDPSQIRNRQWQVTIDEFEAIVTATQDAFAASGIQIDGKAYDLEIYNDGTCWKGRAYVKQLQSKLITDLSLISVQYTIPTPTPIKAIPVYEIFFRFTGPVTTTI